MNDEMIKQDDNGQEVDLDALAHRIEGDYQEARQYMVYATNDFHVIERAVKGKPAGTSINDRDSQSPYIADMTLAALTRKFPRNTMQKMPSMHAVANKKEHSARSVILDYLLRNNVLNDNVFGKSVLSRLWLAAEYAVTYGFCAAYTPFREHAGAYGAPLELIPFTDFAIEPYVLDSEDANEFYITNWWQKSDVSRRIDNAAPDGSDGWIVANLQGLLPTGPLDSRSGDDLTKTMDPEDQVLNSQNGYKVITQFQRGDNIHPALMTMVCHGKVLRQRELKSLTGYPRVMMFTLDPDWQTPFGRSRVRLAIPSWALNSIYMRASAYQTEYNLNPARLILGMRGMDTVDLSAGNNIDAGDNPNANVKLLSIENNTTSDINNAIIANSNAMASVFGNVVGNVGYTSGQGGMSNAPGFAKIQQDAQDIDSNYNRRLMEDFARSYAMNALDVIVSNFTGQQEILLDDQALQDIQTYNITDLPLGGADGNTYLIDWDSYRAGVQEINVVVDYGSSVDDSKQAKQQLANQTLETLKASGIQGVVPPAQQAKLVNNAINQITGDSEGDGMDIDSDQAQQYTDPQQAQQQTPGAQNTQSPQTPQA